MGAQVMSTTRHLIAEFGTREIPLAQLCDRYLGISYKVARERAALATLPVPTYRAHGQKSPLLVRAEDLAALLDREYADARERWQSLQGAA